MGFFLILSTFKTGKDELADSIKAATSHNPVKVDIEKAMALFSQLTDPDMEKHSCEEVLDCLFAIYKVSQEVFLANVATQVIERHIIRGLEQILSPIVVSKMEDSEVQSLVSEPPSVKRQREFLKDRVAKLEEGKEILRDVMRHPIG